MAIKNLMLDSDVVKKLAVYALFPEMRLISKSDQRDISVLGSAKYVLPRALMKSRSISDKDGSVLRLTEAINLCVPLEPDSGEIELAATLEDKAQILGLPFDAGESLLIAILARRDEYGLATGDKRALAALPELAAEIGILDNLTARIACFEQVIATILLSESVGQTASKICKEPMADQAISICMSCAADSFTTETATKALSSYSAHVRSLCADLLVPGDDLSKFLL